MMVRKKLFMRLDLVKDMDLFNSPGIYTGVVVRLYIFYGVLTPEFQMMG